MTSSNATHIAVLSAFALSQPLLDILGRNPTFFAVRDSSGTEVVLFALALVLVPPAVLIGAELLVGLVSPTAARAFICCSSARCSCSSCCTC